MAKRTTGLSIARCDSFVVCDNANSDVHKGGGEVGMIARAFDENALALETVALRPD